VFRKGPVSILPLTCFTLVTWGACNFEPTPKAYALVTLKHAETRIQMVTIMEIPDADDCEPAIQEFMKGFASEGAEGWSRTESACQQNLEPMYQKVMNRETFHATYLAFSPRDEFEYEGRLVLYGIPSSQAQEICNDIAKDVGEKLGVEADCVQGTVG
jgi:hypothetical protein